MDTTIITLTVLVPAALGYAALAVFLGRRPESDLRARALIAFMALLAVWLSGTIIETAVPTLEAHYVARLLIFTGAGFVPVALVAFLMGYSATPLRANLLAGLAVVPTLSLLVTATNPWHGLMWDYPPLDESGRLLAAMQWGPWFSYVHGPYSYGLVALALVVFGIHLPSVPPSQRLPAIVMIFAGLVPLFMSLVSVLGYGPQSVPVTSLSLAAFIPVYAWVVLGLGVTRISVVAYRGIFEQMSDPILLLDSTERIMGANHAAERLLDIDEAELVGRPLDGNSVVFQAIKLSLGTGLMQHLSTDEGRHYEIRRSAIKTSRREPGGQMVICRDVTERHEAQDELQRNERLLRTLVDNSSNGILRLRHVDREEGDSFRCVFANRAAERYLGLPARRLIGRNIDSSDLPGDGRLQALVERSARERARADDEMEVGDGTKRRWMRVIAEPVDDDVAVTFIDITDRKERERQMESYALSDALTGLFNRRGFEQHARRLLGQGGDSTLGAVIFLDINGFKSINDQYGHKVGDSLLKSFSDRLRANMRPQDVIGRFGGDEFVALAPGISPQEGNQLARRLVRALAERYQIRELSIACPASVGLANYPDHGKHLNELLRAADDAMYRAKARSRENDRLSDSQLLEQVKESEIPADTG